MKINQTELENQLDKIEKVLNSDGRLSQFHTYKYGRDEFVTLNIINKKNKPQLESITETQKRENLKTLPFIHFKYNFSNCEFGGVIDSFVPIFETDTIDTIISEIMSFLSLKDEKMVSENI